MGISPDSSCQYLYNQVPALEELETTVPGLAQSVSDCSHYCPGCQGLAFCMNVPTVPNTATSYNDYLTFVVLHHFALLPPSSAEIQQVRGLIKIPVSRY